MTMDDKHDFEDATRGFIAHLPDPLVKAADGQTGLGRQPLSTSSRATRPPPSTPACGARRSSTTRSGLFKVTDGIYQIRGYDLANMTLVEGKTGWIVIDTLLTAEMAKADAGASPWTSWAARSRSSP